MDIIKPVQEYYQKFHIEKQRSPSYVEMYSKSDKEIVMVYVKSKQSTAMIYDNKVTDEKEELELTGSPLKLDLSLHTILDDTLISDEQQLWKKDEATHCPVNIETAREIADMYNKNRNEVSEEDMVPMWILTNPSDAGNPLLLTVHSDKHHFSRGIVNYEGPVTLEEVDIHCLIENYAAQEGLTEDLIDLEVECKYVISGISYSSHSVDDLQNAPHTGVTELKCEWSTKTLYTPIISCKVNFEQEVIVGHLASPCHPLWKSIYALHNINQLLVDMTAAGHSAFDLNTVIIRFNNPGSRRLNNASRLDALLSETEAYAYTAAWPEGGCLLTPEHAASLCVDMTHSSNDFTYLLWDVLRDCETAEELITLLIQALTFISSGKIRPFIDAHNKTYLSKIVLKLSRGHSQATKVLRNLRTSPPQALSLVAQLGFEKTMWEYTRLISLLEHSFLVAGIWNCDARSHESVEQINQTIQDMTMNGGEFTLNPFESLSTTEHSIRLDCESFYEEDANELTVDDFASLKKHGLVAEKKDVNEVPLITDEIDISPWKNLLMKFAQVHVCLEHLCRAEMSLRVDFGSLKPLASRLLERYACERSGVRSVGQLAADPLQRVAVRLANHTVQDQLKKPALWYRVDMSRKENAADKGIKRDSRMVYVFSQLPVFPPSVWQYIEPSSDEGAEVAEVTTVSEELKYYSTKYVFLRNQLINKLPM